MRSSVALLAINPRNLANAADPSAADPSAATIARICASSRDSISTRRTDHDGSKNRPGKPFPVSGTSPPGDFTTDRLAAGATAAVRGPTNCSVAGAVPAAGRALLVPGAGCWAPAYLTVGDGDGGGPITSGTCRGLSCPLV